VIGLAVVVAHNLALAERRKRALRIVSERNLEEVAVPIAVDKEAAEVVHMVVVHTEVEAAVPIAVRTGIEVVQAVHMVVVVVHREVEVAVPIAVDKEAAEVVHTEVEAAVPIAVRTGIEVVQAVHMVVVVVHREVEVAVPNLAVDLDHKTWIIPPVGYALFLIAPLEANVQYHTTGVRANRQV